MIWEEQSACVNDIISSKFRLLIGAIHNFM